MQSFSSYPPIDQRQRIAELLDALEVGGVTGRRLRAVLKGDGRRCGRPSRRWEFRGQGSSGAPYLEFRAGWPQGIAPLGLPQIRTCTFAHTAPHIMSSLRDGSLSESALRLVPDAATVVVSGTRFRVSMHPPCFPPTVS